MNVKHCFYHAIDSEFAKFTRTADKTSVQRLSIMFAAQLFGQTAMQKYENLEYTRKRTKKIPQETNLGGFFIQWFKAL